MSIEDNFLASVAKEGDTDPFKVLEKETSTDSPKDKKPEEVKTEDKPQEGDNTPQKDVPFHQHPRWIERENELKSLREQREADAKAIAELSEKTEKFVSKDAEATPDWFKNLYGDNPEAWQKYSEYERQREEVIEKNLIEKQEQVKQKAEEESKYWTNWVDGEMTKLTSKGYTFDKNEFSKVMLDYKPTDDNNNLDFEKGYKIYEILQKDKEQPEKSQARKQLADTTTKSSPTGEKSSKDYLTANELRRKSWAAL